MRSIFLFRGMSFLLIIGSFLLSGCGTTEEAEKEEIPPPPSASELLQQELNGLKTENSVLKKQISTLEQDNRTVIAKSANLENLLADCNDKLKSAETPPISDPSVSYRQALLQQILSAGVSERLEDNCHYWLGECAYGSKRFMEAVEHFRKVFGFRISEKKDESQVMIANSYYAMGNKTKAKEEYEILLQKFPASPYARRVKEKLQAL
jgi:tetratricopeptide (TPR) repeat protein